VLGGSEIVTIVAVVVTASSSVGAALVTARVSGWRDDRDRERKTKDAAAQQLGELVENASDAVTNALHAFEQRRVSDDADTARLHGKMFDDKVLSVALAATRVAFHFPRGDGATTAYEDAYEGLNGLRKLVFEAGRDNLGADFADEETNSIRAALKRFNEAAHPADASA
jgi:hypothetical protein